MKNQTALAILVLAFGGIIVSISIVVMLVLQPGSGSDTRQTSSSSSSFDFKMSADQCSNSEIFYDTHKICVPACTDDCSELSLNMIDVASVIRTRIESQQKKLPTSNVRMLVSYEVKGNSFASSTKHETLDSLEVYRDNPTLHREIWKTLYDLIPTVYSSDIASFEFVNDGFGSMTYRVNRSDSDPLRFVLQIDAVDWIKDGTLAKAQLRTDISRIIAELSVLHSSQVEVIATETCEHGEYLMQDGYCAFSDARFTDFAYRFWSQAELDQAAALGENGTKEYSEVRYNKYFAIRDEFVSAYAISSPESDYIESFNFFVISSGPATEDIAEQKSSFFYSYPEMVALRDYLRGRLVEL